MNGPEDVTTDPAHPLESCSLYPAPRTLYPVFVLALAHLGMSLCTWLFFIGIAGSLLVILISFFEDLHELIGKD
jgi:hypothetical protein